MKHPHYVVRTPDGSGFRETDRPIHLGDPVVATKDGAEFIGKVVSISARDSGKAFIEFTDSSDAWVPIHLVTPHEPIELVAITLDQDEIAALDDWARCATGESVRSDVGQLLWKLHGALPKAA